MKKILLLFVIIIPFYINTITTELQTLARAIGELTHAITPKEITPVVTSSQKNVVATLRGKLSVRQSFNVSNAHLPSFTAQTTDINLGSITAPEEVLHNMVTKLQTNQLDIALQVEGAAATVLSPDENASEIEFFTKLEIVVGTTPLEQFVNNICTATGNNCSIVLSRKSTLMIKSGGDNKEAIRLQPQRISLAKLIIEYDSQTLVYDNPRAA